MENETDIEKIIDRYVVERSNLKELGYPRMDLLLRFGASDLDAIKVGEPGVSVRKRNELVRRVFRDFACEVVAAVHYAKVQKEQSVLSEPSK